MSKIQIGNIVKVRPHETYQNVKQGAVVSPPILRRNNGYRAAQVTALFDDGLGGTIVEVETAGGHVDLVAEKYVAVVE